jgi:hypothetical protein
MKNTQHQAITKNQNMKIQDLYNITLLSASKKESEKIKVGFVLIKNMGYGKKTIANEETDLRLAVEIMQAGFSDNDSERLEEIRYERTGVLYDENGTIAEEFSETVGDLVDVLNLGDYTCTLSLP